MDVTRVSRASLQSRSVADLVAHWHPHWHYDAVNSVPGLVTGISRSLVAWPAALISIYDSPARQHHEVVKANVAAAAAGALLC